MLAEGFVKEGGGRTHLQIRSPNFDSSRTGNAHRSIAVRRIFLDGITRLEDGGSVRRQGEERKSSNCDDRLHARDWALSVESTGEEKGKMRVLVSVLWVSDESRVAGSGCAQAG